MVEDDLTLSQGIEFTLIREGFNVKVSSSLTEARKRLEEENFHLVLLDVMLPDGNGFELCKEIRKTSQIPVIFLTACDDEVNVVLGLDIGADDYITKPFRVRELVSRIKATLRRTSTVNSDNKLHSGEITIDVSESKCWKGDKEVLLSPMEIKLIRIFILHSGHLLSRNFILDKIWDSSGEFVDDNTLSVYIRRLREKIEDKPSQPRYIETVRGMGYRWRGSTDDKITN